MATNNLKLGASSLQNITTGDRNVVVGDGSGINLTTHSNNVYIGNNINPTPASNQFLVQNNGTTLLSGDFSTGELQLGAFLQLNDMTAPSNPSDGEGRLYKKTGDDGLYWLPDSAGPEVDVTSAGGGGVSDLQGAYDGSTSPEITVDGTRGALTIQDNATPIAANLLEVTSNGGGTTYLGVDVGGIDVVGDITVTGLVDGEDVAGHINDTTNPHGSTLTQTTINAVNVDISTALTVDTINDSGSGFVTIETSTFRQGVITMNGILAASVPLLGADQGAFWVDNVTTTRPRFTNESDSDQILLSTTDTVFVNGSLFLGNTNEILTELTPGASGTVLTGNGTTSDPSWQTPSGGADGPTRVATSNLAVGNTTFASASGANYNHAFGDFALDTITSGDDNVAFGYNAGTALNTGSDNVLVGNYAGDGISSASGNVAVGHQSMSLNANTGGNYNVAMGFQAGYTVSTGDDNVMIGYQAGLDVSSGSDNVFIGSNSGTNVSSANGNVAIGYQTMNNTANSSGNYNIVLGYQAGYFLSSGDDNVALGYQAGLDISSGLGNVFMGRSSGDDISTGTYNTFLGYQSGSSASSSVSGAVVLGSTNTTISSNQILIGNTTADLISGDITGTKNWSPAVNNDTDLGTTSQGWRNIYMSDTMRMAENADHGITPNSGFGYLWVKSTAPTTLIFTDDTGVDNDLTSGGGSADGPHRVATSNLSVGVDAFPSLSTGDYNIAFGDNALDSVTTGYNNVGIGHNAGTAINSGFGNTVVGYNAGDNITTGDYNTAIGQETMQFGTGVGGNNTAIGYRSMYNATSTSTVGYNVAVGVNSLDQIQGATGNVGVGYYAGRRFISGNYNTAVGHEAIGTSLNNGASTYNVGIGYRAGFAMSSGGGSNVVIGKNAMDVATTATDNIAIGTNALGAATVPGIGNVAIGSGAISSGGANGGYNVAIGVSAGVSLTGNDNIVVGRNAGDAITSGDHNIAMGYQALSTGSGASGYNIAFGYQSGLNITGNDNICVGRNSGDGITSGDYNICLGYFAGDVISTSSYNIAIGYNALGSGTAASSDNIAIGRQAGLNITGNDNICIGYTAGDAITSGDYNICIGDAAGSLISTASGNIVMGNQTGDAISTGASNTIIGHQAGSSFTTGAQNTVLGALAGGNLGTSDSFATLIGYNAESTQGSCTIIGASSSNTGATVTILGNSNAGNATNQILIGTGQTGSGTGNVRIGNSSGILINATIGTHWSPGVNGTIDLGTTSFRWDNAWINTITFENVESSGDALSYYEDTTFDPISWNPNSGTASAGTVPSWRCIRVGSMCTINSQGDTSGTVTSGSPTYFSNGTAFPTQFRPANYSYATFIVSNSGTTLGSIFLQTSGIFNLYKSPTGSFSAVAYSVTSINWQDMGSFSYGC